MSDGESPYIMILFENDSMVIYPSFNQKKRNGARKFKLDQKLCGYLITKQFLLEYFLFCCLEEFCSLDESSF